MNYSTYRHYKKTGNNLLKTYIMCWNDRGGLLELLARRYFHPVSAVRTPALGVEAPLAIIAISTTYAPARPSHTIRQLSMPPFFNIRQIDS